MKLIDYISREGINAAEFSRRMGCSKACISRYLKGRRMPGRAEMSRIMEITNGAVTPSDFYEAASTFQAAE